MRKVFPWHDVFMTPVRDMDIVAEAHAEVRVGAPQFSITYRCVSAKKT